MTNSSPVIRISRRKLRKGWSRESFQNYYGLRASVSFSYGSHDEWTSPKMLNDHRRGADSGGIANQLAIFFDGHPVFPGGYEATIASGDAGRCIASNSTLICFQRLLIEEGNMMAQAKKGLVLNVVAGIATTITFDDLDLSSVGYILNGYAGLNWSNFVVHDGIPDTGYQNAIVSPNNLAYNGNGFPAAFTATTSFTLNSFYITAAWNDGLNVDVTGKLGGTTEDFIHLVIDTSGPSLVALNWANIDELDFSSYGGTPHPGFIQGGGWQFALDNVTINAIPIPATLPLFAGGLGALGLLSWRRKRNAQAAA